MILGFKPYFVDPILKEIKVHTFREDSMNRWNKGKTIHFATGTRTKNYKQFGVGVCTGFQKVRIVHPAPGSNRPPVVMIDGRMLTQDDVYGLALRDGFSSVEDFFKWFSADFSGKIIHWTDFRY